MALSQTIKMSLQQISQKKNDFPNCVHGCAFLQLKSTYKTVGDAALTHILLQLLGA